MGLIGLSGFIWLLVFYSFSRIASITRDARVARDTSIARDTGNC